MASAHDFAVEPDPLRKRVLKFFDRLETFLFLPAPFVDNAGDAGRANHPAKIVADGRNCERDIN